MTYKDIVNDGEREAYNEGRADALKEVEAIIDKSKHMMFSNLINRDDLKQKIQELKQIQGDKKE